MGASKTFLITLILLSVNALAEGKYSILQGTTNETTTHFTVLAPVQNQLQFEVVDLKKKSVKPAKFEVVGVEGSEWNVRRLKFTGLDLQKEYLLLVKNAKGELEEARSFKMLNTRAPTGKVAIASCMLRLFYNSMIWDNFYREENRPDVFLFIGDAVYLDHPSLFTERLPTTELEAWDEFVRTRNTIGVYFWDHLVPIFSTWDDHDAGGNNVTATTYPLMPQVKRLYDALFANEEIPGFVEKGPGMSMNFELFGHNFLMLDGRTFREVEPEFPMYGASQVTWMYDRVRAGSNVVVSGTQFFGKYLKKDSYEFNYPTEFSEYIRDLRRIGDEKNAIFNFVSGDVHFSELMLIESQMLGYPTFEISSSPVHSTTFPGRWIWVDNPRRIDAVATFNMINLTFHYNPGLFDVTATSIGWRGNVLFEHRLVADGKRVYERGPASIPKPTDCRDFLIAQ